MYTFDNYSIKDYGMMVTDPVRTQAFITALSNAIKPDSVVLEIGTGAGFFALLACKLGAKKVYAIEPNIAIEVGKLCTKNNPGSERITWLKKLSTEIDLPEKMDIVIGDLHGVLPFYNFNIQSMHDAVARHLKPDGIIIPQRDVLYAVPIQSPEDYNKTLEEPWAKDVHGLDLSAGRAFVANTWWRYQSKGSVIMLAEPQSWGSVDYATVSSPNHDGECDWLITSNGTIHGLSVWFDGEIAPKVRYSNAPNLPELAYGNAFFPLEYPLIVKKGERLHTKFSIRQFSDEHISSWISEHFDNAGKRLARFKQSTFNSRPISQSSLDLASPDFITDLSKDGELTLFVLQSVRKKMKLGDISEKLLSVHPEQFKNIQQALNAVTKIVQRYQLK